MSKKKLELFSVEQLEVIEDIVLKSRKGIILENIKEIKEERKKQEELNSIIDDWNSTISVDQMPIDFSIINVLKANGIYTEKDLIHADIDNIQGLMPSWKTKAKWAAKFFDMSKHKQLAERELQKKEYPAEKKYNKK